MHSFRLTVLFALGSFVLPLGAFAAANDMPHLGGQRVSDNPITYLTGQLNALTQFTQSETFLKKVKAICDALEMPTVKGCPDELKDIRAALKTARKVGAGGTEAALASFKDAAGEILTDHLGADYQNEYNPPEMSDQNNVQEEAPQKPINRFDDKLYPQHKERALVDPFPELLAWTHWLKAGNFYPKVIRMDKNVGIPMIIELTTGYCAKLELPDTNGCVDEVIKPLRKLLAQKASRLELLNNLASSLGNLESDFNNTYGENDEVAAHAEFPADIKPGDNAFGALLKLLEWAKEGRVFPDVFRKKYARVIINEMKDHCKDFVNEEPKNFCEDAIDPHGEGLFKKSIPRNKKLPMEEVFSGFKSDLGWLRDQFEGQGSAAAPETTP